MRFYLLEMFAPQKNRTFAAWEVHLRYCSAQLIFDALQQRNYNNPLSHFKGLRHSVGSIKHPIIFYASRKRVENNLNLH